MTIETVELQAKPVMSFKKLQLPLYSGVNPIITIQIKSQNLSSKIRNRSFVFPLLFDFFYEEYIDLAWSLKTHPHFKLFKVN